MKILGLILIQFLSHSNLENLKPCEKSVLIVKADFKLSNNDETGSNLLLETFESKVPIKPFKLVEKLPDGKNFDFSFEVNPKKINKNTIKVSENGDFKLTIKKGSKFAVLDNDATDGSATIEIPESAINTFIGIPEKEEEQKSTSTAKLTVEDSLYYGKQEIKPLSNKEIHEIFEKNKKEYAKKFEVKKYNPEKEKKEYASWYTDEREDGTWYQIGKRPVPIPSEWKSDNGNDYVLSFKNQGIKQFDFKGYKISNPKDYEYPDGIGKVGVKGGTVSLTGVGKIEIPEGALDNDTTIVLRQELQAYRPYAKVPLGGEKRWIDFLSPIVKIEPFGLKLNKAGKLYLETDKARLGNNSAGIIDGKMTDDKRSFWDYTSIMGPENLDFNDWKDDYPLDVEVFKYYSKQIEANFSPTDKVKIYVNVLLDNFGIKANNNVSHFTYKIKGNYTPEQLKLSSERLESAYSYYSNLMKIQPANLWINSKIPQENNKIPVTFDNSITSEGTTSTIDNSAFKSKVELNYSQIAEEHELFHVFQYAKVGANKSSKYTWITESSAEYMGEKLNVGKTSRSKSEYVYTLDNGIEKLNEESLTGNFDKSYTDSKGNTSVFTLSKRMDLQNNWFVTNSKDLRYSQNYDSALFFDYLANSKTEMGGDNYVISTLYENTPMAFYQDYANHSYLRDRFSVYEPTKKITPSSMPTLSKQEPTSISETFSLYNNSSRYFEVKSTYNSSGSIIVSDDISTLGIKVNTPKGDCENNTKSSVIFLNNYPYNPVKLPQYMERNDLDSGIDTSQISMDRIQRKEVDKDGIVNIKANRRYPFIGMNKDFISAVVVVSNTNGLMYETSTENKSKCSYTIESCLYCFD